MTGDNENIGRAEYETRHAELRAEILREVTDLESKINSLTAKIDALGGKVDRAGTDVWKVLASSTLTLILGFVGGYLAHFIH